MGVRGIGSFSARAGVWHSATHVIAVPLMCRVRMMSRCKPASGRVCNWLSPSECTSVLTIGDSGKIVMSDIPIVPSWYAELCTWILNYCLQGVGMLAKLFEHTVFNGMW